MDEAPKNPVMEGRAEAWDQPGAFVPQVIADGDTLYMWYAAGNASEGARKGYATSVDGIHWDLRAGPVMETGPAGIWNEDIMWPGSVLKEDGVFKMWFTGGVGSAQGANESTKTGIGYATSPDGIRWTIQCLASSNSATALSLK